MFFIAVNNQTEFDSVVNYFKSQGKDWRVPDNAPSYDPKEMKSIGVDDDDIIWDDDPDIPDTISYSEFQKKYLKTTSIESSTKSRRRFL